MLKVSVMQPYIFPYIGYFQLIKSTDVFVSYDDVNYINRGWINRNRILINGQPSYFNIICKKATQNKLIYEIEIDLSNKNKLLNKIYHAYHTAPYFPETYQLIENVLYKNCNKISELAVESIIAVKDYLDMKTSIVTSMYFDNRELRKEKRIIDICKRLNADTYINLYGGIKLYNRDEFKSNGLDLFFIKCKDIIYKQFKNEFIPYLSIIDVMMFNDKEKVEEFLNEYELK